MWLSRTQKVLLGIGSVFPFLWMGFFFLVMFGVVFLGAIFGDRKGTPPAFVVAFPIMFCGHLLAALTMLGLVVFFIYHAVTNDSMSKESRAGWAIGFFIAGIVVMTVYWYLHIWREPAGKGG